MLFVVLLDEPLLVFLCFLPELGTRTERTDGRSSNSLIGCKIMKLLHIAGVY